MSEQQFALVSEWMENGNINEFIEKDQHVNRAELVRHLLARGCLANMWFSWLASRAA